MSDLRTRVLRQADMENEDISPTEVNTHISMEYGDVYQTVADTGGRYFETSTNFTTAGLSYISEPADHLATVDTIERQIDSTTGRLVRLRRIMPQERAMWSGKTGHAKRWELVDDRINLYPTPPSGDVYVLRYIPQPPDLDAYADGATIDVVTSDGLSMLMWGSVVRLLAKKEADVSLAIREREAARARLTEWAQLRAFNDPNRSIVDEEEWDYGPYREGEWWYDR
jgi:hypothetical protein